MDNLLYKLGKIPGALMILPLFLGALINTFAPAILHIGSFTTALFKNGVPVLIGLFFMCIGAQIQLRAALPAVEKGLVLLLGKYFMAVAAGLGVAFLMPDGMLWGLLPLAIIAAMSNSNGSLYVALTGQFGNKTDRGAISVLSLNDGPFLTMVALGTAGLADLPLVALFAAIFPIILGFILGNSSRLVREFLAPGEKLIIPFAAFAIGASINFSVLLTSGMIGIVLGLMTVLLSGGGAMLFLYGWYVLRKRPRPARNVLAGACESAVAGNAIATPAAIAMVELAGTDPNRCAVLCANLGGDTDTIGAMATAICGALHGVQAIDPALKAELDAVNRLDFGHYCAKLLHYREQREGV